MYEKMVTGLRKDERQAEQMEEKEMLDIVDEEGMPTGQTVERQEAHEKGILHRTAHVWLMRSGPEGVQVLLQKRSRTKDSHPGCYDISSAGHIPAGVDFIPSALRELREELGITAEADQLCLRGQRRIYQENVFYGRPFVDNQVSRVYCLWMDVEPEKLRLQASEVESVMWIGLEACKQMVAENAFPHCIALEELNMLPDSAPS